MNVLNTVVEVSKKNMHLFILAIYAYVLFQIEDTIYYDSINRGSMFIHLLY